MAHDDDPCLVCGCVQAEDDLRAQVAALRAALGEPLDRHTACAKRANFETCGCDYCEAARAALALTDAQAGTRWAAMVQVVEAARQIVAHRSDYEANAADVPLVDALAALAALDGGRRGEA